PIRPRREMLDGWPVAGPPNTGRHAMFRYGLRAVLDAAPEIDVVGEAATGRELLAVVASTGPDVVLTDLAMPDLDGAAATRELLTDHPGLAVLVLTMHDDDESVFAALRAGAQGYLLKGANGGEVVRAVLAVAGGDGVYGSAVARRIVGFNSGAQDRYAAHAFPRPDRTRAGRTRTPR